MASPGRWQVSNMRRKVTFDFVLVMSIFWLCRKLCRMPSPLTRWVGMGDFKDDPWLHELPLFSITPIDPSTPALTTAISKFGLVEIVVAIAQKLVPILATVFFLPLQHSLNGQIKHHLYGVVRSSLSWGISHYLFITTVWRSDTITLQIFSLYLTALKLIIDLNHCRFIDFSYSQLGRDWTGYGDWADGDGEGTRREATNQGFKDQVPDGDGRSQGESESTGEAEGEDEQGWLCEHCHWQPDPPQDEANGQNLRDTIVGYLKGLFDDKDRYKNLLALKGVLAQAAVDLFQMLLDSSDKQASAFRKEIIVTMQKLANSAQVYPRSYEIEEDIVPDQECYMASGGFGDIFKCELRGQAVCVKMIKSTTISQAPRSMKQFMKEAILWAQLSHPNIAPFRGFYYFSDKPCLLSPWMCNGHINDYLRNNPSSNRYLLVKDMTEGLYHLHSWGIVHGDLKGTNVMINDLGRACLTDFGISSVLDAAVPFWSSLSKVASIGGSTRWQAPEIFESNNDQDVYNTKMSDVYAWGCICYEVFSGKIPFYEIKLNTTVVVRVMRDGFRPSRPTADDPAWLVWGLQVEFWNLMERCWAREPRERPSVGDLLATPLLAEQQDNRASHTQLDSPVQYRTKKPNSVNTLLTNTLEYFLLRVLVA